MAYRFGTGTTFGEIGVSGATVAAFVGAFLGSAALWWTYFARSAHDASEAIVHAADPGRMARSAYTYFRLPMIAGIIAVAAAYELVVAHPGEPGMFAPVTLLLGGTALFVAGLFFSCSVLYRASVSEPLFGRFLYEVGGIGM
jgi:low temperature requirement protein LtrA